MTETILKPPDQLTDSDRAERFLVVSRALSMEPESDGLILQAIARLEAQGLVPPPEPDAAFLLNDRSRALYDDTAIEAHLRYVTWIALRALYQLRIHRVYHEAIHQAAGAALGVDADELVRVTWGPRAAAAGQALPEDPAPPPAEEDPGSGGASEGLVGAAEGSEGTA